MIHQPWDLSCYSSDTSLDFADIGNGEGSTWKLLMSVTEFSDFGLSAIAELDALYNLHAAKIYKGVAGDLLLILYLNNYDVLDENDHLAILNSVPCVQRFQPLYSDGCDTGWLWCAPSSGRDNHAIKLL